MLLVLSYIDSHDIIKLIQEHEEMHSYYLAPYASYCQKSLNQEQQRKFLNEQRGDWNSKRKRRNK